MCLCKCVLLQIHVRAWLCQSGGVDVCERIQFPTEDVEAGNLSGTANEAVELVRDFGPERHWKSVAGEAVPVSVQGAVPRQFLCRINERR